MANSTGGGRHPSKFSKEEWASFLCEIDCDNPYSAFQDEFDAFCDRAENPVLKVLCSAEQDHHHPAFIRRCHIHADDVLKEHRGAIYYFGSLPWHPSRPIKRLDQSKSDLEAFCREDKVRSLSNWIKGRKQGICFFVDVDAAEWLGDRSLDNLGELAELVASSAGADFDLQRLCIIFFVVHTCRKTTLETLSRQSLSKAKSLRLPASRIISA